MAEAAILYIDDGVDSKLPWLYVLLNKCPVTLVHFNAENRSHVELNPMKIVPFFAANDVSVWGTISVLMYLADKYTSNALYGQTVEERAKMNSILFWCGGTLNRSVLINYVYPKTKQTYSLPGDENKGMLELGLRNTTQQLDTLEEHYFSKSNFICGEKETVVDYYTAIILMELDKTQFDFSKWPKTIHWFTEMRCKVKDVFP